MSENKYIPGKCNIGSEEIKRRRNFGLGSTIITLILLIILIVLKVNPLWRLFIFFLGAMAAVGFIQAYLHFCGGFARQGLFNFEAIGNIQYVQNEESKKLDGKKGVQITYYSVLIGVIVSIIAVSI